MKTECPHCSAVLNGWKEYAEHILAKHKDDEIRVAAAKEMLHPTSQPQQKPSFLERLLG